MSTKTARPPTQGAASQEVKIVKANLARLTVVLTLLASMALTLGAGWRWAALSWLIG